MIVDKFPSIHEHEQGVVAGIVVNIASETEGNCVWRRSVNCLNTFLLLHDGISEVAFISHSPRKAQEIEILLYLYITMSLSGFYVL